MKRTVLSMLLVSSAATAAVPRQHYTPETKAHPEALIEQDKRAKTRAEAQARYEREIQLRASAEARARADLAERMARARIEQEARITDERETRPAREAERARAAAAREAEIRAAATEKTLHTILLTLLLPAAIAAYLAPTIQAFRYKCPSAPTVFIANLLVGWTVIGWVAVWWMMLTDRPRTVTVARRARETSD